MKGLELGKEDVVVKQFLLALEGDACLLHADDGVAHEVVHGVDEATLPTLTMFGTTWFARRITNDRWMWSGRLWLVRRQAAGRFC